MATDRRQRDAMKETTNTLYDCLITLEATKKTLTRQYGMMLGYPYTFTALISQNG